MIQEQPKVYRGQRKAQQKREYITLLEAALKNQKAVQEQAALNKVFSDPWRMAQYVFNGGVVPEYQQQGAHNVQRKAADDFAVLYVAHPAVRDLCEVTAKKAPKVLETYMRFFGRLFHRGWLRDPRTWAPKGSSPHTQWRSLIDHLYVKYPVPMFLYDPFYREEPQGWGEPSHLTLFFTAAQGGSIFELAKSGAYPVSLTKKMCHTFLTNKGATNAYEAARVAQVRAFGGSRKQEESVCASPLGAGYRVDEEFWATFIQWYCANPMLDDQALLTIFDYVVNQRVETLTFSMKGRSALALLDAAERWHKVLSKTKQTGKTEYKRSGLTPGMWEVKVKDFPNYVQTEIWSMEEILNSQDLQEEGRKLRHCVYSYGGRITSGAVSIWSLRQEGERLVTLEVSGGAIIQARGVCNRAPTGQENKYIQAWAGMNNLRYKIL